MILSDAQAIAEQVKAELAPYCLRIEIAGSVRRKRAEVKDIELVVIREPKGIASFVHLVSRWPKVKGDPLGKYTQRILPEGINLDLFMCRPANWGLIYAIRTGSAEFSHLVLGNGWVRAGYKAIGGMLHKDGKPVDVREEEDLFRLIGVPWVPPEERSV